MPKVGGGMLSIIVKIDVIMGRVHVTCNQTDKH